ncbi:hypothetical protein [Paenibacillus daejeonensis]|uniref:hypothetical protein n=1 Tax=Paenibacillus daejeonensis TaxID=135193 RepID=UPI00036F84FD|nr:hypothetical protein [Paenibacillus daejeonensis]
MTDETIITMEDMLAEAELFQAIYPDLAGEIERIENARGKLNDFQLMQAISYAKNGLGVLNYERRQIINSILDQFSAIYRKGGRYEAIQWAQETFGCYSEPQAMAESTSEAQPRIEELTHIIREKEAELLKLYREYYTLQTYQQSNEPEPE